MQDARNGRISLALFIASAVVAGGILAPPSIISSGGTDLSTLILINDAETLTAGPIAFNESKLTVRYPTKISVVDVPQIKARYEVDHVIQFSNHNEQRRRLHSLPNSVSLHLYSAGFEVEPDGSVVRKAGEALPTEIDWTLKPKGPGNSATPIILEVRENQEGMIGWGIMGGSPKRAIFNGRDSTPSPGGQYTLQMRVTTLWGVSPLTAGACSAALALLAFVAAWPIFIAWISRRHSSRGHRDDVSKMEKMVVDDGTSSGEGH